MEWGYDWIMLIFLALFASVSHAEIVVAPVGDVEIPIALPTNGHGSAQHSSYTGFGGGLLVGLRKEKNGIDLQYEAMVRFNPCANTSLFGFGASVITQTPIGLGGYLHVGGPFYPGPAWDIGALAEVGVWERFRPGLRVGYVRSQAYHAKCGNCPQPAHHFFAAALTGSVVF